MADYSGIAITSFMVFVYALLFLDHFKRFHDYFIKIMLLAGTLSLITYSVLFFTPIQVRQWLNLLAIAGIGTEVIIFFIQTFTPNKENDEQ